MPRCSLLTNWTYCKIAMPNPVIITMKGISSIYRRVREKMFTHRTLTFSPTFTIKKVTKKITKRQYALESLNELRHLLVRFSKITNTTVKIIKNRKNNKKT
mgnify:CR=1 FL=1